MSNWAELYMENKAEILMEMYGSCVEGVPEDKQHIWGLFWP